MDKVLLKILFFLYTHKEKLDSRQKVFVLHSMGTPAAAHMSA